MNHYANKPDVFRALHLIGESGLDTAEKNVLRALLAWHSLSQNICWPAVSRIALHTSMTKPGVRKVLRRLENRGVILVNYFRGRRARNGRGLTNQYQLQLGALPPMPTETKEKHGYPLSPADLSPKPTNAPKAGWAAKEKPRFLEAETATPEMGNEVALKENPGFSKPSIEPPIQLPIGTNQKKRDAFPRLAMDGCDEPAGQLRKALEHAGVRGKVLESLARSPALRASDVHEEVANLVQDKKVRNLPAVLVSRLAERAGVSLSTRSPMKPEDRAFVAEIEKLRRNAHPTDPQQRRTV